MTKKMLNLKNMKETLINYSGIQSEFNKIWNTFWEMACMDFIPHDTWMKFFDQCKGWRIEGDQVVNVEYDDDFNEIVTVVWTYNPDTYYTA